MRRLWTVVAMAWVAAVPFLARPLSEAQTSPAPVALAIDGIDLKDVASDRIRLEVRSHVTATHGLKIKSVRFDLMRLSGLPIYLSPITGPLALEKGSLVVLPRIPVTLFFRDLDSLEPVAQAVREGKATVSGRARADLELTLLERLASGGSDAQVDMPIDVTIPVDVPGGTPAKTVALTALRAAQIAVSFGASAIKNVRPSQKAWQQELRTRFAPALVIAEAHYSIRLHSGEPLDFVVRGLGFRISDDKFVLTGEMIEPWKYDPEVASSLQAGEASLVKESCDLLVWPNGETLNPGSARLLSHGDIHLDHNAPKTETAYIPVDKKKVKVHLYRRDSDANYAVLTFARPGDRGAAVQLAPDPIRTAQNWDRLTIFRLNDTGKDQSGSLELISTPARLHEGRIVLDDPVDDRAWGSLLVSEDGAVGMVQEEGTGMVLRLDW
jgi:hypothetical protein